MTFSGVFYGSGEAGEASIAARDGRSAAWMAAGWAAVTGRTGWVAADGDDLDLACLIAAGSRAAVRCAPAAGIPAPDTSEPSILAISDCAPDPASGAAGPASDPTPGPASVHEWARIDARPIRLERLAADVIAALPPGAILCVDGERLVPLARAAASCHPSVLVLSELCRASRGAAVAWAVGAKAAAAKRTVVALTDAPGFAIAAMDVAAAAHAGLPVAVVVANGDRDPAPFELVAAIAGGHGEPVTDPARLSIHLRNAMTTAIPTVLNVTVDPAGRPSLARR